MAWRKSHERMQSILQNTSKQELIKKYFQANLVIHEIDEFRNTIDCANWVY